MSAKRFVLIAAASAIGGAFVPFFRQMLKSLGINI